jgi:hypothetical protein
MTSKEADPAEVPSRPLISEPADRFNKDMESLWGFCLLVTTSCTLLDKAARTLLPLALTLPPEILNTEGLGPDFYQNTKDFMDGRLGGPADDLVKYFPLVLEMIFCRSIDNFLNYVSELLALIFTTRPEALKSNEKISIQEVLQYRDREELLGALTERRVIGLSFNGLAMLDEELDKTLNFPLFPDSASRERATFLVEQRNLAAHNRCVVNRRYLARVPSATEKLGDRIVFEPKSVVDALGFLIDSIDEIDVRAEIKFGIPRTVISSRTR